MIITEAQMRDRLREACAAAGGQAAFASAAAVRLPCYFSLPPSLSRFRTKLPHPRDIFRRVRREIVSSPTAIPDDRIFGSATPR